MLAFSLLSQLLNCSGCWREKGMFSLSLSLAPSLSLSLSLSRALARQSAVVELCVLVDVINLLSPVDAAVGGFQLESR